MLAAVNCATPDAEQAAPAMVTPCEAVKTAGGEFQRVAAARKKAAAYSDEPSLKEEMSGFHRNKWLEAMRDELASLTENGAYELVSLPVGAAALSGKRVLKIKRGAQAEIERFKARYVVSGFEQVLGKDFNETSAPVGHYTTLKCLLEICVQEGLESVHLDNKCAFQNGKLTDLVYVSQPEELGDGSGKVWRLRKALYGLKQAAREWHKVLAELLRDLDFVRCYSDPALYVRKYGRWIIFIWVDDLLAFTTPDVMKPLCDQILARFKGRSEGEIGEIGKVLGMEIMRDRPSRTMNISHRMKIKDLLDSNGMKGCRTSPHTPYSKGKAEEPEGRPLSGTSNCLRAPDVLTYAHYACVVDCAVAMPDACEDTAVW